MIHFFLLNLKLVSALYELPGDSSSISGH